MKIDVILVDLTCSSKINSIILEELNWTFKLLSLRFAAPRLQFPRMCSWFWMPTCLLCKGLAPKAGYRRPWAFDLIPWLTRSCRNLLKDGQWLGVLAQVPSMTELHRIERSSRLLFTLSCTTHWMCCDRHVAEETHEIWCAWEQGGDPMSVVMIQVCQLWNAYLKWPIWQGGSATNWQYPIGQEHVQQLFNNLQRVRVDLEGEHWKDPQTWVTGVLELLYHELNL